jgi:gamma-glutamylcyclotransferase (GGCT)/AIG2-like uncharacterized protein YtfP
MMKTPYVHKKYLAIVVSVIFFVGGWLITLPQAEPTDHSVFVYGTLKYPVIRNVICLCRSETQDVVLVDYKKAGLNIVPEPGSEVVGKIIHVSDAELARLDWYENVPDKYRRDTIMIDNKEYFVYLLNK